MTIVVTMAGLGSRFRNAGYDLPKYEIVAHGKTLFEWSLSSLEPIITGETKIIFVALGSNESSAFIKTACAKLNLRHFEVIELAAITDGQASTVLSALPACHEDRPIAVFNIDTYVNPRRWSPNTIPSQADGWALCFNAPGSHWSFASVGPDGWATAFAEKKRISDHATVGLYFFKTPAIYKKAYADSYADDSASTVEKYVAPIYNQMISRGLKVAVTDIPYDAVIPLGTPSELENFRAKGDPSSRD